MGLIVPFKGMQPQMPALLAPNATLVGDVRFGPDCSVWFGAVLRGDIAFIQLGARCNVQDNCTIHVNASTPCVFEDDVGMGHNATAHACHVESGSLIGMGARVLDGARIGSGSLVAANCVVPEGMQVPPGSLVAGLPGRVVKPLRAELIQRIQRINRDYVDLQQAYGDVMRAVDASP